MVRPLHAIIVPLLSSCFQPFKPAGEATAPCPFFPVWTPEFHWQLIPGRTLFSLCRAGRGQQGIQAQAELGGTLAEFIQQAAPGLFHLFRALRLRLLNQSSQLVRRAKPESASVSLGFCGSDGGGFPRPLVK
jgi:hypothetical protein